MSNPYGVEYQCDVEIPQGDPAALLNLLERERAAKRAALAGLMSPLVIAKVGQCDANLNGLLDHFPNGVHRDTDVAVHALAAVVPFRQRVVPGDIVA